ncbi:hypothetical protein PROFUN_01869 [Planoprotostelium fungivorum]|uniref:Uncharacterized protein n=1 Tax=Planoprotostelium fungivorum TaxID=1890364 RepID=A0A2P6NYY5_9EUKA|nr:hypothetical protein PROFUN_01869 [Planoprotostelium fungivorum]
MFIHLSNTSSEETSVRPPNRMYFCPSSVDASARAPRDFSLGWSRGLWEGRVHDMMQQDIKQFYEKRLDVLMEHKTATAAVSLTPSRPNRSSRELPSRFSVSAELLDLFIFFSNSKDQTCSSVMRSFLLFLCVSLFGSALAYSRCQVNSACCFCSTSTCNRFTSNPAYGLCDDGTSCGTCSSSTTSSSGTSSSGTSASGTSSSGASSSGTSSSGTSSSGTSNGQYASLSGKYTVTNPGTCQWSKSYTVTPTGTNTYYIIPSDTTTFTTATIQQYSDYSFSISSNLQITCQGTKPNAHNINLVCSNGCYAVLTGGSGMVMANIFLIVAAVSALLVL